jgi:hypothetical protein
MTAVLSFVVTAAIAPTIPASTASAAVPADPAAKTVPAAGPIDPNTGYPFWYQDTTGERYELCFDRAVPASGLCLAAPQDPAERPWVDQDPANSNVAADPEAFWTDASADIRQGGTRVRFVSAMEATFGGPDEAARAGEQISFGRIRVRLRNMVPGATYTVTHPYGTQKFVADETGDVFYTEDIGCLDVPCNFTKPFKSSVTSFLRWDPATGDAAPAGYVGNPDVEHEVVGSPVGTNYFRVQGPHVGGPGVNVVETDLFSVQGKLWSPTQPMLGVLSTGNTADFGTVPYVAPTPGAAMQTQTLTLTNAGAGTAPSGLDITGLGISGTDAGAFTVLSEDCTTRPAPLTADETCTVQVGWTPQGPGVATAQLDVASNGLDSSGGQRILLRGRASDGADAKDLRTTGPISLRHGYPLWFGDENGTQLALCDDPDDALCLAPAAPYSPAAGPMSLPDNFPEELFWWSGEASTPTNGKGEALLVMAQEAAFALGDPAVGDQVAFGRVRIRVDNLVAEETYHVTTPYGDYDFVAQDDGKGAGEINYTEDIGCLESPCDFPRVNQSNVGPFLGWTAGAPEGYLGDPDVESTVTGGPNGNVFRVEGPDAGGPGVNSVETDQFSVSGKRWTPPAQGTLALKENTGTIELAPAGRGAAGEVRTLTLTNVGQAAVTGARLSVPPASPFAISSDQCSNKTLAPGTDCTVGVSLQPKANAQSGAAQDFVSVSLGARQVGTILLRGTVAVAGGPKAGPSMPALQAADDTGLSTTDNVTRATQLTFSGATANTQPVTLLVDGTPVGGALTPVAATYSETLSVAPGTHTVTAAYADGTTSAPFTVTVDRARPAAGPAPQLTAGTDTGVGRDGVTADRTPTVTGTATADVAAVQVLLNGRVVGEALVQPDGTWRFTLPTLRRGTSDVTTRPIDLAGNVGTASPRLRIRLDVASPSAAAPRTLVATQARATDARVAQLVTLSGRDAAPGALAFQVQASRDGRPFVDIARTRPGVTSVRHQAVIGSRYRYRARAIDAAGNTSAWVASGATRSRLVQQDARAVRYVGSWARRRAEFASGGTLRFARRDAGAVLSTRARSVTLIASTGPQRGRAAILVDGRRVRTVDLYSAHGSHRRPVATVDGLSAGRRSRVEVRALGTKRRASSGTRVDVDAFVVVR